MDHKAVASCKRRMLAKLNKAGPLSKTALTNSVRDHLAVVRRTAFYDLHNADFIETKTFRKDGVGRPVTMIRINPAGKREVKLATQGIWH